jgi:hypothetical protein
MWALLTLVVLAAEPLTETALFAFELEGTPVGTVQLSYQPATGRYRYRSWHLFARGGETVQSKQLEVQPDLRVKGQGWVPESLWLWRRPPPGCLLGREELGTGEGPLCAESVTDAEVTGTVFGRFFVARYQPNGRLDQLTLGAARFQRLSGQLALERPADLFGSGFPIEGTTGPLALTPPARPGSRPTLAFWNQAQSRALAKEVHRWFEAKPPVTGLSQGPCLVQANRFVHLARQRGHQALLVLGLLEEDGRAYPHAWVRIALGPGRWLDLDPSSLREVTAQTHLPLEGKGRELIELLSGRAKVVRRGPG